MLRLATVRSHDQFNTTIYSYNDRYRGVKGDRMIVFINAEDRAARGLDAGVAVALETISADGIARRVEGLTLIDYPMSRGSIAGYYPELNPLLPLDYRSEEHTSELQSLMRISYAVFCLKKKKSKQQH